MIKFSILNSLILVQMYWKLRFKKKSSILNIEILQNEKHIFYVASKLKGN